MAPVDFVGPSHSRILADIASTLANSYQYIETEKKPKSTSCRFFMEVNPR